MKIDCAHDEMVELTRLQANPRNPNQHPKKQIEMLAKIIEYQGQRAPIVVSRRSGFIVKGHGRLEAIKALSWDKAAVDYQDYEDEAQEFADMVADNKISELAEHDDEMMKLGALELDLDTNGFDLDLLGIPDLDLNATPKEDRNGNMAEKFMAPPFSVLDARQGWWQDRKRQWLARGIKSEVGRGGEEAASYKSQDKLNAMRDK